MCIGLHKGKLLTTKSRYIEVCSEKKNSKEGYLCILRAMVDMRFCFKCSSGLLDVCKCSPPSDEYLEKSTKYLVDLNES